MASTIPANQLVNVTPSVVGTGGSPLSLNAVFLSNSTLLPINTIVPFSTADDVKALFGVGALETENAEIYFRGFTGANKQPSVLYFYRYVISDGGAKAWVRGGSLGLTLTQLKALNASITIEVDGDEITETINLSAATSFLNAAQIIEDALGATVNVYYNAWLKSFQIETVSGGDGSTITFATGSLANALKLANGTGATLSQGADDSTPVAAMEAVAELTQNWATFMTMFEPDLDDKLAFAEWTNEQSQRYAYVAWDTDINAKILGADCLGVQLQASESDGTILVYAGDTDEYSPTSIAAFVCGLAASIDFTELNGRTTLAFRGLSGLIPNVTNATVAANLLENGYNFYGSYATATQQFNLFQNGQITGKWRWADAYLNQIFLNSQLQQAILSMLTNIKSLPYNEDGYSLLRAACLDPINAGLNFGSIRRGIPLSEAQAAEVNNAAGLKIDSALTANGWYLQILAASAQTRGNRTSPPMKLWYTDGGSIQQINLASINVM